MQEDEAVYCSDLPIILCCGLCSSLMHVVFWFIMMEIEASDHSFIWIVICDQGDIFTFLINIQCTPLPLSGMPILKPLLRPFFLRLLIVILRSHKLDLKHGCIFSFDAITFWTLIELQHDLYIKPSYLIFYVVCYFL